MAGAAAAAVLSLILLILGTGLGFSAVSPWSQQGISASSWGMATIGWLAFTQIFASGLGGYLAGRLRSCWVGVSKDEVYFRDTAHGFLSWTMASLVTAALLTSVVSTLVGGTVQAGASVMGGAATAGLTAVNAELAKPDTDNSRTAYFIDSLFRIAPNASTRNANVDGAAAAQSQSSAQKIAEVTRIFMNTLRSGPLSPEDASYVGQLVAQRTGLSQQEAEQRVQNTYADMQTRFNTAQIEARQAADKARKASMYTALWLFVALLAGAFVASWFAICGGRRRDMCASTL